MNNFYNNGQRAFICSSIKMYYGIRYITLVGEHLMPEEKAAKTYCPKNLKSI